MEFKFRAGDDRPPPYLPPSSSVQLLLRASIARKERM
ncbi:hypothetical protein Pint_14379 [Pistacia integerrima]|uniref:Uncharacterized protein n=1 Tax=Pistacia integerrima TaxID=434235 RepID=A0ACC0Y8T6_9ROSI|nr:hypothetical protein Pint_14379 [Pistacia integerrima]